MRRLLLGNEALALGARAAGVTVATGYPGTPSTEILEHFARYPGASAEWASNEKVALEIGLGAALAGARTMVTMKHVGLNVAADPFFASAYIGVRGGLVIVCADDPGMDSSQGEQDSRNYAKFAKVPLLEPADSQECFDMMALGLELSEQFDTPVLLRTTRRVSHAQSVVDYDPAALEQAPRRAHSFERDPAKHVMLPVNARRRRVAVEGRLGELRQYAETAGANAIRWGDRSLGILTSSVAYHYAREAFPEASILKLGLAYPFPADLVASFAQQVDLLLVVEELDPYLEEQTRVLPALRDVAIHGRDVLSGIGELSVGALQQAGAQLGLNPPPAEAPQPADLPLPARPPVMCAGCPHRGAFHVLSRLQGVPQGDAPRIGRVIVSGDIGCYTLGALPPLNAMDTCVDMGASIGMAIGLERAGYAGQVVAVIGDGTFYHSGMTGLVDVVYGGTGSTILILDNGTTAMTGGNPNPGSGQTITGQPAPSLALEDVCRALGVADTVVVDAHDIAALEAELKRGLRSPQPTVIVARAPCRLKIRGLSENVAIVDPEACTSCESCLRVGCPALIRSSEVVAILADQCTGCALCAYVCPHDAIAMKPREVVL